MIKTIQDKVIKPIVVGYGVHKRLEKVKEEIQSKTNIYLNFDSVINIVLDCISKDEFNNKINLIKQGIGR